MSRLFAWFLIALGAFFALITVVGMSVLITGEDPDWVTAPVAAFEAGDQTDADWVRITRGHIYWPAASIAYEENLRTKERKPEGLYAPLVSRVLAAELETQRAAGETPDLARVAAIVFISQAQVERDFAYLATGRWAEPTTPYAVQGRLKRGRALPLYVKQHLREQESALDPNRVVFLEDGATEFEWGGMLACAFFSILLLRAGRRRRRLARAPRDIPFALQPSTA